MGMINLLESFANISIPKDIGIDFNAISIHAFDNHKIAKDKLGNPVLLLYVPTYPDAFYSDFKLKNLRAAFNVICRIKSENRIEEKKFVAIYFTGKDHTLKEYFVELCVLLINTLGNTPRFDLVRSQILRLSELLRFATEPEKKTIQGLWAELFLISISNCPKALIRAWHSNPYDKFDFSFADVKIEVKSSTNGYRLHTFSIDQLHPPNGSEAIIASIFVKRVSNGKSIMCLRSEIEAKLAADLALIGKLRQQVSLSLGKSIMDAGEYYFDFSLAKNSLQFFNASVIPKVNITNVPNEVSSVKFTSDLSGCNKLTHNEVFNYDPLSYFNLVEEKH